MCSVFVHMDVSVTVYLLHLHEIVEMFNFLFMSVCMSVCVSVYMHVNKISAERLDAVSAKRLLIALARTTLAWILLIMVTLGQRSRSQ